MYNLKTAGGSFKGTIGECLFKIANNDAIVTKFFNKQKYFTIFGNYFTPPQRLFLESNWYSIDAIEIVKGAQSPRIINLFEIKTRNKYPYEVKFKPKMTLNTHLLYNQAKELNFQINLATVWLLDNWNYSIEISDFSKENYCLDKPKEYDARGSQNK